MPKIRSIENPGLGDRARVKRNPGRRWFPSLLARKGKNRLAPVCGSFLFFPLGVSPLPAPLSRMASRSPSTRKKPKVWDTLQPRTQRGPQNLHLAAGGEKLPVPPGDLASPALLLNSLKTPNSGGNWLLILSFLEQVVLIFQVYLPSPGNGNIPFLGQRFCKYWGRERVGFRAFGALRQPGPKS